MKQVILFLMISILAVSCGGKGDTGKASFKLSLGNMLNANASYFSGGLLIIGHRLDDSQSFTLAYTDGLQLDLQKGAWEFATVGWTSAVNGPMTGPQQCSYQLVELRDDIQSINFSMSQSNCRTLKSTMNDQMADSQYFKVTYASGTVGFKKLALSVCSSIDANQTCTLAYGSSTINSYQVSIAADVKGVVVGSLPTITSNCMTVSGGFSYSELTLPYGGDSGFLGMNLGLYNSADCSGTAVSKKYNHGLAELQTDYSSMSSVNGKSGYGSFNYLGDWSSPSAPPNSGYVKGDMYKTSSNISGLGSTAGDSIYFNGTNWGNLYTQVTIIDGAPYFDADFNAYLFIKM